MKSKVIVVCFDCKSVNGLTSLAQAVENMDSHEFHRGGKHHLAAYQIEDLTSSYVVMPVAKYPLTDTYSGPTKDRDTNKKLKFGPLYGVSKKKIKDKFVGTRGKQK